MYQTVIGVLTLLGMAGLCDAGHRVADQVGDLRMRHAPCAMRLLCPLGHAQSVAAGGVVKFGRGVYSDWKTLRGTQYSTS